MLEKLLGIVNIVRENKDCVNWRDSRLMMTCAETWSLISGFGRADRED